MSDGWPGSCAHALPHMSANPTPAQSAIRRDLINPDIECPLLCKQRSRRSSDVPGEYRDHASTRPSRCAVLGPAGPNTDTPGRSSVNGEGPRRSGALRVDQPLLLAVVFAAEVGADVVERAARRAEAGVDLVELGGVEGRAEALQALFVAEAELGGEIVALEQADVVDAAGQRLRRLDLDRAVALEAGGRRDQLADDHVLLQAREAVDLALERRVGEDLRGLLEGGRREEGVRGQRGLGDAEDDLGVHGRLAARGDDLVVDALELVPVDVLARQQVGVALLLDAHLLEHLPDDQLDVLVVDVHALRLVDLLDFLDQVDLGVRAPTELEQLVRVQRALVELLAGLDDLALGDVQSRAAGERVPVLLARFVGDDDRAGLVGVLDGDGAADLGDLRQALRLAGLEELHDTREAVRDVRAGDAAGVEGTHGQLRARLADRLGGNDADRVADHRRLAGRQRAAVALLAHADGR